MKQKKEAVHEGRYVVVKTESMDRCLLMEERKYKIAADKRWKKKEETGETDAFSNSMC